MTDLFKWRSKAELIILVKQHPSLWDSRLEDYKHSKVKPIHWAEIADALESTPALVEKLWYNIRSSYQRSRRSIQMWESMPPGSSGRPKSCPQRYKYYQELSFLDDILSVNVSKSNVKEEGNNDADDDDGEMTEEDQTSNSYFLPENFKIEQRQSSSPRKKRAKLSTPSYLEEAGSEVEEETEESETSTSHMRQPDSQMKPRLEKSVNVAGRWDDDDFLFCMRMYQKLRSIESGRTKDIAKLNMEQKLLELKYGNLD